LSIGYLVFREFVSRGTVHHRHSQVDLTNGILLGHAHRHAGLRHDRFKSGTKQAICSSHADAMNAAESRTHS
jgi:hypothetical protein